MTTPRVAAALEELRAALLEELLGTITNTLGSTLGSDALAPLAAGRSRRSAAAAAPSSRRRAKGAKRTQEEIAEQGKTVLAFVKKNPGSRAEQISKETGIESKDLALVIKNLLAEKSLGRKGVKRATSYTAK
jgi:hypothetical protein